MKKGIVKIGFKDFQVGGSIQGPTNLMLELESEGYIELDSDEPQEVEKSKRGRKPKKN